MRYRIREAIIVEGRYDKNTVSQVVDTLIIETEGFRLFSDSEKLALIGTVARRRGIVILTDSDSAGFLIRNHIKGAVPAELIKHAYIPDIMGKERRKSAPSREGKLGVEGVGREVIVDALRRAGAIFEDEDAAPRKESGVTRAQLYDLGLTGGPDSGRRREELKAKLGLPARMSAKALFETLDSLYTAEELRGLI